MISRKGLSTIWVIMIRAHRIIDYKAAIFIVSRKEIRWSREDDRALHTFLMVCTRVLAAASCRVTVTMQ